MPRLLFVCALTLLSAPPSAAQNLPDIDGRNAVFPSTESGFPGDAVGVPITAGNNGTAPAPDFPAAVYLSRYPVVNGEAVFLGRVTVPGMGPQQNSSAGTTVTVPDLPRGGYYLVVALDDPDTVAESNETNNVNLGEFTMRPVLDGPDMVVGLGVLEDAEVAPGDRVSVEYDFSNVGQSAVGDFPVGYYLSTDSRWSPDDLFLERETLGGIDPGETEDESDQVTIPPSTPPGQYRFLIVLDDENAIAERNETNNAAGAGGLTVTGATSGEGPASSARFNLMASPNPTSASVVLGFALPQIGEARLTVYDTLGRLVSVADENTRAAGTHEVTLDTSRFSPGLYVARLDAGGYHAAVQFSVVR